MSIPVPPSTGKIARSTPVLSSTPGILSSTPDSVPRHCQHCGALVHLPVPLPVVNALLDHILLVQDAVKDLKRAIEEAVL